MKALIALAMGVAVLGSAHVASQPVAKDAGDQRSPKIDQPKPSGKAPPTPTATAQILVSESSDAMKAEEHERKARRDDERADRDLKAQEHMANWAFWLLIVTVVSSAVSGVGIFFLWLNLRATRDAIKTSADATLQMEASNSIAAENLDAFRQTERARILPLLTAPAYENGALHFEIILTNTGRTSTMISMIEWDAFATRKFPDHHADDQLVRQIPSDGFFGSFENKLIHIKPLEEVVLPLNIPWNHDSSGSIGFIIGRVSYDGLKPRTHRSYFCYQIGVKAGSDPLKGPFHIQNFAVKHDHPEDT